MNPFKNLSFFFRSLPEIPHEPGSVAVLEIRSAVGSPAHALTQEQIQRIARLRWYFAHASVGSNLIDGLADLHKAQPDSYRYTTVFSQPSPPSATQPGVIYEHNRGNPGWKTKIDDFESCVRNGWHFPQVDVAMNKLCYIDQRASLKYHIHSMVRLEADFP